MSTTTRGRPIGTITLAVLQALADAPGPLTVRQVCEALADVGTPAGISSAIDRQRDEGCIQFLSSSAIAPALNGKAPRVLSLTAKGYRLLRETNAAQTAARTAAQAGTDAATAQDTEHDLPEALAVATPRDQPPSGQYAGRELRPYTGRPGAMDAFRLPSRQGGHLVPRRPPIVLGAGPQIHLGRSL